MGHLLGAIDKAKLDNQRGVVQNEKRQSDNEPYGLVEYAQLPRPVSRRPSLSPPGRSASMADLNGSQPRRPSRNWFRAHYGPPNNGGYSCWPATLISPPRRPRSRNGSATFRAGPEDGAARRRRPHSQGQTVDQVMKDHVATYAHLPQLGSARQSTWITEPDPARHRAGRSGRARLVAARQTRWSARPRPRSRSPPRSRPSRRSRSSRFNADVKPGRSIPSWSPSSSTSRSPI